MALPRRAGLALLLAAPASAIGQPAAPRRVVASFSILADMVGRVGETRIALRTLAGAGQDMHAFEPRPSDIQAVARADVMVINGLGLEGWAGRIAAAAGFKGITVVAARGVAARKAGGHHGGLDPHAWQDVANAIRYVGNIRDGLAAADPAGAAGYAAAAARYSGELAALDAEIRALFDAVPAARRRAVTSHDAFGYFADAYGVEMLAIAGTWNDAEPSARELASLAAQVKRQKVRALFLENTSNSAALRALASETDITIGGQLFADALSAPDGPAATYVDMMRHNARTIAAALR